MEAAEKPSRERLEQIAYNVNEAAAVSGFGRNTIYDEISAGRLIARKFGRRTVISRSDLESWISNLPRMAA